MSLLKYMVASSVRSRAYYVTRTATVCLVELGPVKREGWEHGEVCAENGSTVWSALRVGAPYGLH